MEKSKVELSTGEIQTLVYTIDKANLPTRKKLVPTKNKLLAKLQEHYTQLRKEA